MIEPNHDIEFVVGFDNPESPGLFGNEFDIHDIHFINQPVQESCKILAKPRYRDPSQSITYHTTMGTASVSAFHHDGDEEFVFGNPA